MTLQLTNCEEWIRRVSRAVLSPALFLRAAEFYNYVFGMARMGWRDYRRLRALAHDRAFPDGSISQFQIGGLVYPISVRKGTSDATELIHSVVRNTYAAYMPDQSVRVIIDAGANIGDSAVWYLSRFPAARVVAIEPDPDNFRMLALNSAPYGDRAVLLQAALWPRTCGLCLCSGSSASDVSVRPAADGETPNCRGLTPLDLLELIGEETIDIFKCDIEGAESELFSDNCDAWLRRTRSVYVDIHNGEAESIVTIATRRNGFSQRRYRELHVFLRP